MVGMAIIVTVLPVGVAVLPVLPVLPVGFFVVLVTFLLAVGVAVGVAVKSAGVAIVGLVIAAMVFTVLFFYCSYQRPDKFCRRVIGMMVSRSIITVPVPVPVVAVAVTFTMTMPVTVPVTVPVPMFVVVRHERCLFVVFGFGRSCKLT